MKRQIDFCDLAAINAPYTPAIELAWKKVLQEGRYIGGPEVNLLEKNLINSFGVAHAVGTGNGLDALTLALKAFVIEGYLKPGDHILVPANTYIASILAVIHAGLYPVPVDIDPHTMVVTAETIQRKLTPHVKGLMTVHLYGRAAWDKDIKELVEKHGLIVLEDNAQAIGAVAPTSGLLCESCFTGALGLAAAFSFYPTKNIGAIGDAGAVTTQLPNVADTVRALANYGSVQRFENRWIGHNSRLDPLQAVALLCKLPGLEQLNAKRRQNAATLTDALHSPHIVPPVCHIHDHAMVWHQYVVTLQPGVSREDFREHMHRNGVQTDIHYPLSAFLQPCFKGRYVEEVNCYVAPDICNRIVSLPVNQTLGTEEMLYIAQIANTFKP